ncbi:hypothetical protein C4D60_Mb09t24460 [Musa balbisiana]|uniref:Uncharacterized protein n=1 Tax=Musa balbisiana TaxID=52838 RepID=A0A4S8IJI9_MUSBA|nr:hypothetical protein C4D60_Mb09t24460 [Musa balbisiana]
MEEEGREGKGRGRPAQSAPGELTLRIHATASRRATGSSESGPAERAAAPSTPTKPAIGWPSPNGASSPASSPQRRSKAEESEGEGEGEGGMTAGEGTRSSLSSHHRGAPEPGREEGKSEERPRVGTVEVVARSSTGYIFKDEKGQTVIARAISWRAGEPSPLFLKHYSRTLPMTHSCGRSRSQSPRSLFLDPSPIIVISQILDPKSANMRSLATRERAQDNSSIIVGSTSYDHNCQTMGPSTVTLRPLPLAMLTVGVVVDPLPPASQEDDASHLIVFQLDMIIHIALLRNDPTFSQTNAATTEEINFPQDHNLERNIIILMSKLQCLEMGEANGIPKLVAMNTPAGTTKEATSFTGKDGAVDCA